MAADDGTCRRVVVDYVEGASWDAYLDLHSIQGLGKRTIRPYVINSSLVGVRRSDVAQSLISCEVRRDKENLIIARYERLYAT